MHQGLYLIMFLSIEGDNEYRKELGLLLCTSQNINFFGEIEILKNKILKWLKMRLKTQSAKFPLCLLPCSPSNVLSSASVHGWGYDARKSGDWGNSQKKKKNIFCKTSCLGKVPTESNNVFVVIRSLTPKEKLQVLAGSRASAGAKEGFCAAGATCGLCRHFVPSSGLAYCK